MHKLASVQAVIRLQGPEAPDAPKLHQCCQKTNTCATRRTSCQKANKRHQQRHQRSHHSSQQRRRLCRRRPSRPSAQRALCEAPATTAPAARARGAEAQTAPQWPKPNQWHQFPSSTSGSVAKPVAPAQWPKPKHKHHQFCQFPNPKSQAHHEPRSSDKPHPADRSGSQHAAMCGNTLMALFRRSQHAQRA